MDPQTFEQEEVAADVFGSAAAFLVPDITVTLNFAPDGVAVSGVRHAFLTQAPSWVCNIVPPEQFLKEGIKLPQDGSLTAHWIHLAQGDAKVLCSSNLWMCGIYVASTAGKLPQTVQLKVVEAEPYAKGDSATSSYKQCTVESGARVAVPPYVQAGESILVDTASGTFAKRVIG